MTRLRQARRVSSRTNGTRFCCVAYLAAKVPDGAQLVNKIDWNMEGQPASSQIKGEEKYWWTARGVYNDNALPATANGTAYGAIVKIAPA